MNIIDVMDTRLPPALPAGHHAEKGPRLWGTAPRDGGPWHREFLTRCETVLGLEAIDLCFAGLRAGLLVVGLSWRTLAPDWTRAPQLPILAMFLVFSIGLYLLNAVRPGRIAMLYRVALVFDLGLVFLLVRITGGFASEFHLGFTLLIAVHAFYFGLATGLGVAAASGVLYALAGDWPPPMPAFAIRIAFDALVGACLGVLSEHKRRQGELLRQQQEQLAHFDRVATVGELAAGLAHELRNPLAGISGALHVLSGQYESGAEQHVLLSDVQAQIARMNKTLSDLLQLARPRAPQLTVVDVNTLLSHSLRFVAQNGVEVVPQLKRDLPPLLADANLLHQAFLNILVNARQAMPQGGRLTIRTRLQEEAGGWAVVVEISDTGIGIPLEHRARIFQPFFTTKAQGTGLGLPIAARIIEQHGGRIAVDSAAGHGTTFRITLPSPRIGSGAAVGVQDHAIESAGS